MAQEAVASEDLSYCTPFQRYAHNSANEYPGHCNQFLQFQNDHSIDITSRALLRLQLSRGEFL